MAQPPQLPIEMFGVYPDTGTYAARIRRFDGLVYDPADETFKLESKITGSAGPFVPLVQGTGNNQTIRSAFVSLTPGHWVDGDYIVYFHDTSTPLNMVVSEFQVQIWGGNWASIRTPTTTEIALRLFSVTTASHNTHGTFGGDWNLMKRQLAYIGAYIEGVSGKPFPTS